MTGDAGQTAAAAETREEGFEGGWPDLFHRDSREIPPSDFGACHRMKEAHRWAADNTLEAWSRGADHQEAGLQGAALCVEGAEEGGAAGGDVPNG